MELYLYTCVPNRNRDLLQNDRSCEISATTTQRRLDMEYFKGHKFTAGGFEPYCLTLPLKSTKRANNMKVFMQILDSLQKLNSRTVWFCNQDDNVVLIELKQWSHVTVLPDEGNFVETYIGKAERIVPHPAQQTKGYNNYLKNFNPPKGIGLQDLTNGFYYGLLLI